ncbi:hypothetical protein QTN25_004102 [Entamoeba marina]
MLNPGFHQSYGIDPRFARPPILTPTDLEFIRNIVKQELSNFASTFLKEMNQETKVYNVDSLDNLSDCMEVTAPEKRKLPRKDGKWVMVFRASESRKLKLLVPELVEKELQENLSKDNEHERFLATTSPIRLKALTKSQIAEEKREEEKQR